MSVHSGAVAASSLPLRRPLLLILLSVLLIKAAILFLDSTPRLFIGDSLSYLFTALTGWIPPDRSFVYGFLIRPFVVRPHLLPLLVACQALLSAISAWLVAVILLRYFQTTVLIAAVCSLLCAVEPLQLLEERYVLTESLATLLFAVFLLLCFEYLAKPRLAILASIQVCGVLLISLRISFLPLVILCSVALPFFTRKSTSRPRNFVRQRSVHVLFGLLLSQLLLFGYRHLYAQLIEPPMHGHPAYFYRDGLFLVSDFAPLIKPVDYPIARERSELFRPSRVPLAQLENRDAQRWYPDGICDRIIKECHGDEDAADALARKTAIHALKRDPLAAIKLGVQTAALYFYRPYFVSTLITDEGYDAVLPPAEATVYRRDFGVDFNSSMTRFRRSPPFIEQWHRALYPWYWFLLLLPFLFCAYLIWRRRALPAHFLSTLFLFLFLEGAVLTVTRPTARFLTTMAWLSFVVVGSCFSHVFRESQTPVQSPSLEQVV